MAAIQERLDAFKTLSLGDQKAKIILMLTDLKDTDKVFVDLLDIVQNNTTINADFLVSTYHDIMDFAEAIRENNKDKAIQKLNVFQERIRKIHEIEEADRAKENPEDILKQI